MRNYNSIYDKLINNKLKIPTTQIKRGNFYMIKSYKNVDGIKKSYSEIEAPIIFVLYASKKNDEVHAIKLSNTKPSDIKKLFSKLINEDTNEIQLKGQSSSIYNSILKKVPKVTSDAYRTYKWSGIESVFHLDTNEEKLHNKK